MRYLSSNMFNLSKIGYSKQTSSETLETNNANMGALMQAKLLLKEELMEAERQGQPALDSLVGGQPRSKLDQAMSQS